MARTRTRSLEQPDENQDMMEQDAENGTDSRRRRRRGVAAEETSSQPARKDRPTPSAKQAKQRAADSTGLISRIPVVRSIVAYFRGVAAEAQKVSWPTREETTRLTGVVLGVTIVFAITLGILDAFLAWWFQQAYRADSEIVFIVVAVVMAVVVGGTYTFFRDRI